MAHTPISDVSDTALWVAAFRAKESARPDALFADVFADRLVGDRGRQIAREMPYPKIMGWIMSVRTVVIDRLVQEAIAAGVDTVINIGAGLDTRPYRLDIPRNLDWIEIDFPHIIALKNEKLEKEKPRCRLSRVSLDVSDRTQALMTYQDLGAQTNAALIITEGVIPYLSNEDAAQLAKDLRSIPSFRFWIQDYYKSALPATRPPNLKRKLANAPFRFRHPDPLAFFERAGWKVRTDIKTLDEADRLGRPFPAPFPFNHMMGIVPKVFMDKARAAMGYVLLEAC